MPITRYLFGSCSLCSCFHILRWLRTCQRLNKLLIKETKSTIQKVRHKTSKKYYMKEKGIPLSSLTSSRWCLKKRNKNILFKIRNAHQQFSDESIQKHNVYLANVELKVSMWFCKIVYAWLILLWFVCIVEVFKLKTKHFKNEKSNFTMRISQSRIFRSGLITWVLVL